MWSIDWAMNRTEPSARAKFAPPEWFDRNPHVTDQFHRQWFLSPDGLLVGLHEAHDELQLLGGGAPAGTLSMGQLIGWIVCPWAIELPPAHPGSLPVVLL